MGVSPPSRDTANTGGKQQQCNPTEEQTKREQALRQGAAPTRGTDRARGRDRPAAGASERTSNQSQPAGTDRSRAPRRCAFRRAQEEARQAAAREVGGAESGRLRSRRAPKLIEARDSAGRTPGARLPVCRQEAARPRKVGGTQGRALEICAL
ncbi:hypothetical protein NDU88_006494 [Pleurodeles waltl]|uniref:Uncharacterized protein n=1 Tax=Pleurodeles waltl TaxID=8319 RepID=A0AAV7PJ00_PLEWA|nr:hypothetical protein NDU88_006494 [Pleurodeles waltl]